MLALCIKMAKSSIRLLRGKKEKSSAIEANSNARELCIVSMSLTIFGNPPCRDSALNFHLGRSEVM